tara:strand:- start:440 stop:1066 length:627 start_codon:yes stop_codon:yes gene_type:complete
MINKFKTIFWRVKDYYFSRYSKIFYSEYKFNKNYFIKSDIQKNLHKYIDKRKKNFFLEIGTYEGLASIWFAKKYLSSVESYLDIVDPFIITDKTTEMLINTEENFLYNYSKIKSNKIKFFRMKSDDFFKLNNKKYNFIYLDGSHELDDITNDLINADKHLLENGIIWCDDYGKKSLDCYIPIDNFYEKNKDRYEIIFKNYQIAFRKKN